MCAQNLAENPEPYTFKHLFWEFSSIQTDVFEDKSEIWNLKKMWWAVG